MKRLRNADFREYKSALQALQSGGYADMGLKGRWLFGLARPLRNIPFLGKSAARHELFHAVDDLATGPFRNPRNLGSWARAEVLAHTVGGPLAGMAYVTAAVAPGGVVYYLNSRK